MLELIFRGKIVLDSLIIGFDNIFKTLSKNPTSTRKHPDSLIEDVPLSHKEKQQTINLMRVNHCGEVCAQGLYQGQMLVAKNPLYKEFFKKAAAEEIDHLAWTSHRITELGGKTSFLNPMFYLGSLAIGAVSGMVSDKWSLGFLAETEAQVGKHLSRHLDVLPNNDKKSMAILEQMKYDEAQHEQVAYEYGGVKLPYPVKKIMQLSSKIMTKVTYYV